jgi:hypothetical protein
MLVNELAEATEDLLLVVDDYHVIHAPEVHRSVEFPRRTPADDAAARGGGPQRPPAAARAAARPGSVAEVRAADLRFTFGETAQLLGAPRGRSWPAAGRGVGERTEGWAAGLQLAALSLRAHRRPRVRRGVLRQPPLRPGLPDRGGAGPPAPRYGTFLLETSVLERLSGPLCDAVLGSRQPALAEAIERPTCSCSRSTASVGGGATTTCSPTCCAPGCPSRTPTAFPSCIGRPPTGTSGTGCPTTRSGTRWPRATPSGGRDRRDLPRGAAPAPHRGRHPHALAHRPAACGAAPAPAAGARRGDRRGAERGAGRVEALLAVVERTGPGPPYRPRSSAGSASCPTSRRARRCVAPTWPGPGRRGREVEQARAALARPTRPTPSCGRCPLPPRRDRLARRAARRGRGGDDRAAGRVVDIRPMARAAAGRVRPRPRPARPRTAGRGPAHVPLARSAGGRRGVGAGGHVARRRRQGALRARRAGRGGRAGGRRVERCRRLAYAPPL